MAAVGAVFAGGACALSPPPPHPAENANSDQRTLSIDYTPRDTSTGGLRVVADRRRCAKPASAIETSSVTPLNNGSTKNAPPSC